jgi:hypothetical protein
VVGDAVGDADGVAVGLALALGLGPGVASVAQVRLTFSGVTLVPETPAALPEIVVLVAAIPPEYASVTAVVEFVIVVGDIVNVPVVSETASAIGDV